MASFNKTIIVGNCTRDPSLRSLPNETSVVDGGIASNRKFRTSAGEDREEVLFQDFVIFGKPAETFNQYVRKGKLVLLEGHLKTEMWDDKNGGGKRSKNVLVVENFQFLGGKEGGEQGGDQPFGGREQQAPSGRPRDERGVPRGNWNGANLPQRSAGANFKHPPRQPNPPPQQPFGDDDVAFKEADIPF